MFLMSWAAFIGGGFQMVALKVGSYAFPREQAAMMSGIASGLVGAGQLRLPPADRPLVNQQRWDDMFWLITACPAIGVTIWLLLSRERRTN